MKIIAAILGIALIIVGGTALRFWREADAGRQQIAELQARLQEQQAQPVTSSAMPGLQPAVVATPPEPSSPPSAATAIPLPERVQATLDVYQAQASSPEQVAQRMELARVLMARTFPDIDEAIGLSPEEARKLIETLARQQDESSAVFRSGRESGDTAATSAAYQEHQRAVEAELQAMLGSKYARYQDYRATLPVWAQRRDLRAVLDAEGAPLTDTQSKALIAALTAEQRLITQETRQAASQGGGISALARNTPERNQRLLNAAAPHLTPQQLDAYRGMLDRAGAREQATLGTLREAEQRATQQRAADAAPR